MTDLARGQEFNDRYRSVSETVMIDMLRLEGCAFIADQSTARHQSKTALDDLIKSGLKYREGATGERKFDPVEVVYQFKAADRRRESSFWGDRMVPTLRHFVSELSQSAQKTRSVTYQRQFNIEGTPLGKARLRMPLPLSERYKALHIDPILPAEVTQHRVTNGRLEARVDAQGLSSVTFGATFDLELNDQQSQSAPGDFSLYLRPKEGLVVITDPITALAQRLAGTEPAEIAVRAFWDYMIDNFMFVPVHYDQVTPDAPLDWVVQAGHYDCQLASSLFIALCRARGIPARLVGGNFLYRLSPTNHYWAEVWLDDSGWTPFDFLSWDLSKGGTDDDWRDHFFGKLDARLITESLPDAFVGPVGVAIPPIWHILRRIENGGVDIRLESIDGRLAYTDKVTINTHEYDG